MYLYASRHVVIGVIATLDPGLAGFNGFIIQGSTHKVKLGIHNADAEAENEDSTWFS